MKYMIMYIFIDHKIFDHIEIYIYIYMIVKFMISYHDVKIHDHDTNELEICKKNCFCSGIFCRASGINSWSSGIFCPQHFLSWDFVVMFGISLPSRSFSSKTLMDGESVIASQHFSNLDDDALMAELQKLEDCIYNIYICSQGLSPKT